MISFSFHILIRTKSTSIFLVTNPLIGNGSIDCENNLLNYHNYIMYYTL